MTPIVYVPPGVKSVVEIVTAWVAPAVVGVMLNDSGFADSPVTEGTETVHVTEDAVPLVRVATTFGAMLEPAAIVVPAGFHVTV